MSITAFAVRNYRFVIVAATALFLLGVLGFAKMPRQEDPDLSTFGGVITVIYPGASVDEIEDRVLEPLEEGFKEIEEIEEIRSTARDNVAVVVCEIREDVDKDDAYDEIVQRLAELGDALPAGVTDVEIRTQRPLDVVVFQIALASATVPDHELKTWAEELEARLRVLDDAAAVKLEGEQARQVHVTVDPARLAATGLDLTAVSARIAAANGDVPGGIVRSGNRRLTVRPIAKFHDLADIGAVVLGVVDGRPVRLADVATVAWGSEDPDYLVRQDGRPAVLVTVTQKEGRNVFSLAADVERVLDGFRRDLPPAVALKVVHDQARSVRHNLRTFTTSLIQGGLVIVLLVALITGFRSALTVVVALGLSVGMSFLLLERFGLALDQMSIAGLVTVLGLLVDNAIVVVEGILRARHEGLSAVKAAVTGADRVGGAVASSTATTVAAFVPMILMEGSVGEFTRSIPIVVSVVLAVSLLVALTITPLTGWALFRSPRARRPHPVSSRLDRVVADRWYAGALRRALAHPRPVLAGAATLSLACLSLTPLLGMSFFPAAEKPMMLVRVEAPRGTAIAATAERADAVAAYVSGLPGVTTVTTNVGKGNPQIYYNQIRQAEADYTADLLVVFDGDDRVPGAAAAVRERFANDPDVVVKPKIFVQGPPIGLPVSVELTGDDLDRLGRHAATVENALRAIPGAVNVENDLQAGAPRLDLEVDPVAAGKLGLDPASVAGEVRYALAGGEATLLREGDEDYPVVVRVAPEGDERFADLERVRLPLSAGGSVPLAQVTRPALSPSYAAINHVDLKRSVVVGADTDGRLAADVLADLMPTIQALDLAPDESWKIIGEDEERDRAFLSMLTNLVTAVGLIYGILVLQFRSFKQPLIVFTSLPVALTGSAMGLLLGGWSFGFTAFIGLLALAGIVVNNAIVLVDQINQNRAAGSGIPDAILDAARSRLQPILLTTGTTVAGLLPLTLSRSSLWSPMGWVIIGGLLVSTLVTLILVPTLYAMVERGPAAEAAEETSAEPGLWAGVQPGTR